LFHVTHVSAQVINIAFGCKLRLALCLFKRLGNGFRLTFRYASILKGADKFVSIKSNGKIPLIRRLN
jgi:hypothetical protein